MFQNLATAWLLQEIVCSMYSSFIYIFYFTETDLTVFFFKWNVNFVQTCELGGRYSKTVLQYLLLLRELFTILNLFKCLVTTMCLESRIESLQIFIRINNCYPKNLKFCVINLNIQDFKIWHFDYLKNNQMCWNLHIGT